jgi:hypothetical protein
MNFDLEKKFFQVGGYTQSERWSDYYVVAFGMK